MEETLHAHLRQPILKILHSHGITKASSVSLQVFSSLLDKYLKSVVDSCQEYANHAGRPNLSVYDVLESLEEMGTVLDDLRDYLEVECGVSPGKPFDGVAVPSAAESSGIQKYAKAIGPRKEAELHEFKDSVRQGLPASEDRLTERLRYTRLNTPDAMDLEPDTLRSRMIDSDSEDYDNSPKQEEPVIQLPLSPVSNSPPHGALTSSRYLNGNMEELAIPSFLPPFPIASLDPEDEKSREKEEELKREAELQKQKEAEEQEKEKDEGAAVAVQTFPANYIMPAPYEVSKLQARGTWHLPSLSLASMEEDVPISPLKTGQPQAPPVPPFIRGTSTTEELLSALHALTSSNEANPLTTPATFGPNAMAVNPLRHKISLVFLGTTPARYNTPDTLFGLSAALGPTPRPANPLPTHIVPIDPQPGGPAKGKGKEPDPVVPPSQGKPVGSVFNIINAVTGTSSRIPAVSRQILARPTLTRTKRLAPPPAQKRDERPLLYHTPNPSLPAHWNLAVSGSNSQYVGMENGKGKPERNPFGVAESTLAFTWDWNEKVPWEGLDKVKGGIALASTSNAPVNGPSTPGGSGATGITKERTVPKISVNVPGRRSSTLSAITPAPGTGLASRLSGLGERSPIRAGTPGSMLPPPVPAQAQTLMTNGLSIIHSDIESSSADMEPEADILSPMELVPETPKATGAIPTRTLSLKLPPRSKEPSVNDKDILAIADPLESAISKTGTVSTGNAQLDADIDAEIAEVMGEEKDDIDAEIEEVLGDPNEESDEDEDVDVDAEADIDADIADVLGPESSPPVARNASSISNPFSRPLDLPSSADIELEKLLESSTSPSTSRAPSAHIKHDIDIDMLGVVPEPPGEGSAFILSDLDYVPASDAGTLVFASSTTLPLATSAFRSTTTPLPPENSSHFSSNPPTVNGTTPVKSEDLSA